SMVRYYPHNDFMCHVLGFVNYEGIGSSGVEQLLDKYLRGCPGVIESNVNAFRQELYTQRNIYIPALEGADVFLNLDQNIQHIVEKSLDAVMERHKAKAAWAIVQRVRTGELLGMACRPSFNLNDFYRTKPEYLLNRAIGNIYEPGSTFKAGIIAMAIDRGCVSPDTIFDCENGEWKYGGRVLRDHHNYAKLTVADILKKSSNIGAAKIALTLGDRRMYEGLKAFGLGQALGIDLPGEEKGILHPASTWSKISPTRIAIGQGVAVTALQMLGLMCAIGNDGFLMRPHVVQSVVGKDGTVLLDPKPEVLARPISSESAAMMRDLLARVTENGGTGMRARVEGYKVAGKTGTAQKAIAGGYSETAYVASFVGFLPADDPEIGIIVVVDEPQPIHTGGAVAGPVFSEIAGQTVRYLDISPARSYLAGTAGSAIHR
ncbi:MAG: penicillin-binding protein 2, partial [Lentisphaerae bacterium]|nr:penicillin-binding protein 2 [Lentisphaerota bacterium]